MIDKKTILVAPLNWGLGHAARCIPIINALQKEGYAVIMASDGGALDLLKKEFPTIPAVQLPGYQVSYSKKGPYLKTKLLASSPRILQAIKSEHKVLYQLIDRYAIDGIISDNRLGLYTTKVPTVIITHQLNVLSGKTTLLSTYIHNRFIKRFQECWVPDTQGDNNLSGVLGHPKKTVVPTKYIGPLSRMRCTQEEIRYKAIAVLSGPEPQRTLLENILLEKLKKLPGKILLVQGIIGDTQVSTRKGNIEIINFLTTPELEKAINCSEFVIARSGYTTIMDLACMGKKAFFIPTPGQPEQEYLAKRFQEKGIVPYSTQEDFKIKYLSKVRVYKGFNNNETGKDLRQFFRLFHGERKLRPDTKLTLNIDLLFVRFYNMLHNRKTQT